MAHQVETMAYTGDKPWHGLGHEVGDCLTPKEILKAAKLNWKVHKVPLYAEDEEIGVKIQSEKHSMLVRDNGNLKIQTVTGETLPRFMDLGPAGPDYQPFQNEEVFTFFNKFTEAGNMKMETAGSLCGGKHVWALAKINSDFELPGGDKIGGYLLLNNPHIWGKAAIAMLTPVRVVCNNTLTFALERKMGDKQFRMPHMNAFADYAKAAEEALGLASQKMGEFKEAAEFLAKKQMTPDLRKEYMIRVLMPKTYSGLLKDQVAANTNLKEVIANTPLVRNAERAEEAAMMSPGYELESARGTFWGALNGVTYLVDHRIGRSQDTALEQAWFGDRAALKREALNIAVDMANAA